MSLSDLALVVVLYLLLVRGGVAVITDVCSWGKR